MSDESADADGLDAGDLDLNAYALLEVVKQMTPLLDEHVDLYSDLRRRLVERSPRKRQLSLTSCTVADIAPHEVADPLRIKAMLGVLAQLLHQHQTERVGVNKTAHDAIQQLQTENRRLYDQISRERNAADERSESTDEPHVTVISPLYRSDSPRDQAPRAAPKGPWSSLAGASPR
jgi:hypothetical protein